MRVGGATEAVILGLSPADIAHLASVAGLEPARILQPKQHGRALESVALAGPHKLGSWVFGGVSVVGGLARPRRSGFAVCFAVSPNTQRALFMLCLLLCPNP